MESVADLFVYALYVLDIGATLFFLHKVLWLLRYKRLQAALIQEAAARVAASQARRVEDFDRFADAVWRDAADSMGATSLGTYVARVDDALRDVRRTLRTSRSSIRELAMEAAASDGDRTAGGTALTIPAAGNGSARTISWELTVPPLVATRRIDPQLYALKTKSRYGFFRRALVFFAGIADVVYSVQHVAVMSQNPHAPTGVLMRRLSLVVLMVVLIMGDLAFGIRAQISSLIEANFVAPDLRSFGDAGALVTAHFGTIAGVVVWTLALSLVYFAAAVVVRRRSLRWQKRLDEMKAAEKERLSEVQAAREADLLRWLDGYTRSLDQAVELGAKHAELLADYHRGRLHRRVVESSPVRLAKVISAALLAELPEASGDLADRATSMKRSFWHHLWPRESEMRVEVEMAQMRAAWQDIEWTLGRLTTPRPQPEAIDGLFRRLVTYAGAFQGMLPVTLIGDLHESYQDTVEAFVGLTTGDLDDLDARLQEIAARLTEQLSVAGSLVRFQVEMTNHKIETSVNKLAREVLATRERARLEAMAFEI
ncbi:MAG: hypothetical protein U0441_22105 [Polyangiaceae bacterium]